MSKIIKTPGKDWVHFSATPFLYPAQTGLLWHQDRGNYTGAYAYYTHPKWNSQWGGELLVCENDQRISNFKQEHIFSYEREGKKVTSLSQIIIEPALENEKEDEILCDLGRGNFISSKPNRIVFMNQNTFHKINHVSPAAGDHVRTSVAGFFIRPKNL